MHRSMLPNPSNFQENQQLPGIEQNLYGQLDQTVENHQQMLQAINTCRHLMILSSGCLVKFQSEEEGDEREEISFDIIFPDEFYASFSTPLNRILSDDDDEEHYISDLLQRYCGAHLESYYTSRLRSEQVDKHHPPTSTTSRLPSEQVDTHIPPTSTTRGRFDGMC
ncbi:hypothetical protein WN943_014080 [Citrus x changshan-huyou]